MKLITVGALSEVPAGPPEGIPSLPSPARSSHPHRGLSAPLEEGLLVWSPRHRHPQGLGKARFLASEARSYNVLDAGGGMKTKRAAAESSELHHRTFLPPALKTASPSHACRDHATSAQGSASSLPLLPLTSLLLVFST